MIRKWNQDVLDVHRLLDLVNLQLNQFKYPFFSQVIFLNERYLAKDQNVSHPAVDFPKLLRR